MVHAHRDELLQSKMEQDAKDAQGRPTFFARSAYPGFHLYFDEDLTGSRIKFHTVADPVGSFAYPLEDSPVPAVSPANIVQHTT